MIGGQKRVLSLNNHSEFIAFCSSKAETHHSAVHVEAAVCLPARQSLGQPRIGECHLSATRPCCSTVSTTQTPQQRYPWSTFQGREVLTGCRCTHIMEVMLRIPTPMPINNQDASRDERQVLLMRNSSV